MLEWEQIGAGPSKAEREEMRREQMLFEIEERAAIKEFCGNMPRKQAEAEAKAEVMAKYFPIRPAKKG